jgi:hypothetical protein
VGVPVAHTEVSRWERATCVALSFAPGHREPDLAPGHRFVRI